MITVSVESFLYVTKEDSKMCAIVPSGVPFIQ